MATPALPRAHLDPRWYQIAVLSGLLGWGLFRLGFDLDAPQVIVTLGAALATQLGFTRIARMTRFDAKSALISGLSLCLLLRTDHLVLAALAAFVAIASKFALRVDRKHVFNPTNFGITLLLALGAPVWVSPGQWGNVAFFAFLMAALGGLVVNRAARGDVTLAFLGSWAALLFGRALWLGQRFAIPLHQLQSGALLLFAFFMISDPRTTPRSRAGRILFAALVACGAATVQFLMYRTNGLLWSLVACSLAVPLIDRLLPGPRYEWSRPVARYPQHPEGDSHATPIGSRRAVPEHGALADSRA
jgi:Na+-transporting NADH:ubiquinone oxidoreductase subunit NqrB